MTLQPVIDNLPMVLVSFGFVLWAAARLLDAYAKKDPAVNEWDSRAAMLHTISDKYSQAIEWLVVAGAQKWTGAEKLEELNRRVKAFEEKYSQGKYLEAIAEASGFFQSAKAKIEKMAGAALPFVPRPSIVGSQLQSAEIGPDDQATDDTLGK